MNAFFATIAAIMIIGWVTWGAATRQTEILYQQACIAKYDTMPHNKVGPYCVELLKFKKEPGA
jgi:hypothetical protein